MNQNHIDTKLTFSIPYGVNRNGYCLTKGAIENALNNLRPIPIVDYTHTDDNSGRYCIPCGAIYGGAETVKWDDKNQQCLITVGGILYNTTPKIVINEMVDGEITSMNIVGISLNEIKENNQ